MLESIYYSVYVEEIYEDYKYETKTIHDNKQNWNRQFRRTMKLRTIIGMMLQFFQQACGINLVVFYSTNIIQKLAFQDQKIVLFLTLGTGFILLVTAIFSGYLTNNLGRRITLLYGQGICAFTMLLLAVLNSAIESPSKEIQIIYVVLIYVFIISFGLSLGPTIWLYNAEILTEKGVSLATTVNWICCFTIGLLVPQTYKTISSNSLVYLLYVFGVLSAFGLAFIYYFVVETKGLDCKEVNDAFEKFLSRRKLFKPITSEVNDK